MREARLEDENGTGAAVTRFRRARAPRYRGVDRRNASPAVELRHVGRHAAAVVGVFLVALAVIPHVDDDILSVVASARVIAGCLAILAAGALLLAWRLDGRAQSWWLALGFLALGTPALLANLSLEVQNLVSLSSIAVALLFFAGGWRSPEVDSVLSVLLAGAATVAGFLLTAVGVQALDASPGFAPAAAIAVAICAAGLATVWWRTQPNRAWFAVPLLGLSLCCIATALPTTPAARGAQVSSLLLLINGLMAVVTMAGLQAVTGRHRTTALAAERERDLIASLRADLEARFAETLHEVRSIVLALEGGIRVFGPTAVGDATADSITASLVSELERLRLLADPDHASIPSEFNLSDSLRHLSALSQVSADHVTWDLDPRLTVRGRPAEVAQIVHSLLNNAAKHAPGRSVQVSALEAGQFVLVLVDDDGPGVKPADRERVFQRGARPAPQGTEGHGLGLHIARGLARGLGGELWVEQRPGGGARFVLALRSAFVPEPGMAVQGVAS